MTSRLIQRHRPLSRPLIGTLGAAALLALAPIAPVSAQQCDDKEIKVLSEEWLLSQVDCAADKGLNAGKDMLQDAAKSLAATAIDAYLPGFGSILFGGNEDPFAAHAQRILSRIDALERSIISGMVEESYHDAALSLAAVSTTINDYDDDSFPDRVTNADSYDHLLYTLHEARIALQWPRASRATYDLTQLTTEDIPRLHALATSLSLLLDVLSQDSLVEAFVSRTGGGLSEEEIAELPISEWAIIRQNAKEEVQNEVREVLYGEYGIFDFLYNSELLFRSASDKRFGTLHGQHWSWRLPGCTIAGNVTYNYTFETEEGAEPEWYWIMQESDQPSQCNGPARGTTLKHMSPSGHVFRERYFPPGDTTNIATVVNQWIADHKYDEYMSYIRQSFGPIRPALTSWTEMIDERWPGLGDGRLPMKIDNDLAWAVVYSGAPAYQAAVAYGTMIAPGQVSTYGDQYRMVDRLMDKGPTWLNSIVWGVGLADPLSHGGVPLSYIRPLMRAGGTDEDRGEMIRSQFAAKLLVIR